MIIVSNSQTFIHTLNYKFLSTIFFHFSFPKLYIIIIIIFPLYFIVKITIMKNLNDTRELMVAISVSIALVSIKNSAITQLFFSTGGIILILGVIEASYSMAYLDELTGIPSRRALKEDLLKLGNKFVISMIDIDLFKKFNDTYGHDVGDEILKLVAKNLTSVSGGGKAYRYGGEEFTILFPGKTIIEVIPQLEKLRIEVSKSGYKRLPKTKSSARSYTPKPLYVTISLGVAEKNSSNKLQSEVMAAADKALYRAKKKGRNCVSK